MPFRRIRKHADYSKLSKVKFLARFSKLPLYIFIGGVLLMLGIIIFFFTQIPSPENLSSRTQAQATKIYDRNGELLYDIFEEENRTPIKLEDIPQNVKNATIAIEDKDFYNHRGFSITGILRSSIKSAASGQIEGGGSTLTQQLIKNALLTDEQSWVRKVKELILAVQVEHAYTKDEILGMYLNEIPYGGTAYGIEAAANLYFGKHASELDLAEASLLAGLPQRPSVYSPYGSKPELAKDRQKDVLRRMVEDGHITQAQADEAAAKELTYRTSRKELGFKAPHFVLYVKSQLEEQFGQKMVEQGGLKVYTTLDYKLQQESEKIVNDEIAKLDKYTVGNGSAVVMNPKNGHVLAMVGSKDYFADSSPEGCAEGVSCLFEGNVNLAVSERQPGSATKPITYAAAMQKGYTAASMIMDVRTEFAGGAGSPSYIPVNYDGIFRGPSQVRYALGNSLNIPAVKAAALVGVKNNLELGYKMGLTTWEPTAENVSNVGLSLPLGGREVQLLDLTTAYGVFADKGRRHDPVSIVKVEDAKGKVLIENKDSDGVRVLDEGIAFIIANILADNGARAAAFGTNSILNIPGKTVSVKTGTTDEKRDNWAVGFTPSIVVGTWVGNNNNEKMNQAIASGITGASPIWQKVMIAALKDKPNEKPDQPGNVSYVDVDGLMGGQPREGSPTRKEYFIKGTEPSSVSSAYQRVRVCKSNPHRIANDGEDAEDRDVVVLQEDDPTGAGKWQSGIDAWVITAPDARLVGVSRGCSGIPGFSGGGSGGAISITNVSNGANVPRIFDVVAAVNSPAGVRKVTWTVDGAQKASQTKEPFSLRVEFPNGDRSSHTITVTLEDNDGKTHSSTIGVTVAF